MSAIDTILPLIADMGGLPQARSRAHQLLGELFAEPGTSLMVVVGNGQRETRVHGKGVGLASLPGMSRRVVWIREVETITCTAWSPLLPTADTDPIVVRFFSARDRGTPAAEYDVWDASDDMHLILGFAKAEA